MFYCQLPWLSQRKQNKSRKPEQETTEEIAKEGETDGNKEKIEIIEEAKNTMEDINRNEVNEDKRINELKEEIEVSLVDIHGLFFQCLCLCS